MLIQLHASLLQEQALKEELKIFQVGEWLSLVEHSVRDAGVGGSNPLFPTIKIQKPPLQICNGGFFCLRKWVYRISTKERGWFHLSFSFDQAGFRIFLGVKSNFSLLHLSYFSLNASSSPGPDPVQPNTPNGNQMPVDPTGNNQDQVDQQFGNIAPYDGKPFLNILFPYQNKVAKVRQKHDSIIMLFRLWPCDRCFHCGHYQAS